MKSEELRLIGERHNAALGRTYGTSSKLNTMLNAKIHPDAQEEMDTAIASYEEECEHLGIEFLHAVDYAINRIVQKPATWPPYADMPAW